MTGISWGKILISFVAIDTMALNHQANHIYNIDSTPIVQKVYQRKIFIKIWKYMKFRIDWDGKYGSSFKRWLCCLYDWYGKRCNLLLSWWTKDDIIIFTVYYISFRRDENNSTESKSWISDGSMLSENV